MKKNQDIKFNKIEIDEKTNEPYIVEVTEDDLPKTKTQEIEPTLEKESIGNQLVMKKVFGVVDENDSEDETKKISARQKKVKAISTVAFIVLIVGVLCWTFYKDFFSGDKTQLPKGYLKIMLSNTWGYILLAILAYLLCYVFKGFRLSVLSKQLTGKFHLITCLKCAVFGLYYNYATPFAIGGPPFEIYYLSTKKISTEHASAIPLSSYVIHQTSMVIMVLMSVILFATNACNIPVDMKSNISSFAVVLAIIGLVFSFVMPLLVVIFCISKKAGTGLINFVFFLAKKLKLVKDAESSKNKVMDTMLKNSACIKEIASKPSAFLFAILFGLLEQMSLMSIAYFTLKTFGLNWEAKGLVEWIQVLQICFLLQSAVSFIPTPGNSGAADLSFYLLFSVGLSIGFETEYSLAFPAMMTWRLLCFYLFILVGAILNAIRKKRLKSRNKK